MGARARYQRLGEGGEGQDILKLPELICCVTSLLLWSRKTRAVEIPYYSQSEIKTQMRSSATNQTGLLIAYSNEGTRKQR